MCDFYIFQRFGLDYLKLNILSSVAYSGVEKGRLRDLAAAVRLEVSFLLVMFCLL